MVSVRHTIRHSRTISVRQSFALALSSFPLSVPKTDIMSKRSFKLHNAHAHMIPSHSPPRKRQRVSSYKRRQRLPCARNTSDSHPSRRRTEKEVKSLLSRSTFSASTYESLPQRFLSRSRDFLAPWSASYSLPKAWPNTAPGVFYSRSRSPTRFTSGSIRSHPFITQAAHSFCGPRSIRRDARGIARYLPPKFRPRRVPTSFFESNLFPKIDQVSNLGDAEDTISPIIIDREIENVVGMETNPQYEPKTKPSVANGMLRYSSLKVPFPPSLQTLHLC